MTFVNLPGVLSRVDRFAVNKINVRSDLHADPPHSRAGSASKLKEPAMDHTGSKTKLLAIEAVSAIVAVMTARS